MSEFEDPLPNYFSILPAHVRYAYELDLGARMLYSEITALSNMYGYCFAGDQFFADLYHVDVRTIKRWIHSLKAKKYIAVETKKEGMKWRRKIWISPEIKRISPKGHVRPFRRDMDAPFEGTCTSLVLIQDLNKKEEEGGKPPNPPPTPMFSEGKVRMPQKDYDALVAKHGKPLIDKYVANLDRYSKTQPKKFKAYGDHACVIETWMERDGINSSEASPEKDPVSAAKKPKLTSTLSSRLKEPYTHGVDFGWVTINGPMGQLAKFHVDDENGLERWLVERKL